MFCFPSQAPLTPREGEPVHPLNKTLFRSKMVLATFYTPQVFAQDDTNSTAPNPRETDLPSPIQRGNTALVVNSPVKVSMR